MTTWLITGCSTGLGRALAHRVLSDGDNAVVTARGHASLEPLVQQFPDTALALALDVTDTDRITTVVEAAHARFGAIDVLVNNAGYGYRSAVEEAPEKDTRRLFDTNFFGPVALVQAVLPAMRSRKAGTIVNISSIAAQITPAGSGFYAASKAALEAMSGALRRELDPLGISVITIEPGSFRTDFAGRSLAQSPRPIGDYADTAGRRRIENDTTDGTQPGDPAAAARAIVAAVAHPQPPGFLLLGSDAVELVTQVQTDRLSSIATWQDSSTGTDYTDPTT